MRETETARVDVHRDNPEVGHEASDTSFRGVVAFGIGLIVFAIVAHVAIWFMFRFWQGMNAARQPQISPLAEQERGRLPRGPVLEGFETADRLAKRRAESAGHALSVDEAMKLLEGNVRVRSESEAKGLNRAERPWDSTSGRILEDRR